MQGINSHSNSKIRILKEIKQYNNEIEYLLNKVV